VIKLLVVDDSALMRRLLARLFTAEGDFDVEVARDGREALARLPSFAPDVITLDVEMPQMDGLACLDAIMLVRPCPVVMVSSLTTAGAETTLEAMQLGAVDFVPKPDGAISLSMDELAPVLVRTVRDASRAHVRRSLRLAERVRLRASGGVVLPGPVAPRAPRSLSTPQPIPAAPLRPSEGIVLVGCSTGGPPALDALLTRLPASFPWPVLVAQHMPVSFTGPLARRLDGICALTVVEAAAPMPIAPGHVYIGRGDADMIVSGRPGGPVVTPAPASPEHRWHPSVDRLVSTAMQHVPATRLVGVLMTGMGNDGAAAMTRLHAGGGHTIAEAEETAVVWGMPGELVRAGGAEAVLPLDAIATRLLEWAA
jgi:two-component system chemotaxis response regulator CheB